MGEFIENNLDIFYWLTIVMLAVASVIIIAFSILQMINNKTAAKKTLLTTGGLVVILLLSYYVFASDEILSSYKKYNINSTTSNWVGMGIWSFYLLSIIAVGSIIVSEISHKISK
jgi:steroid 5-alpha reductase family enzyme|tara:strand:- start:1189 stop:1533 length:345 start_codon:yes stop_codon:yes gene_type:complete